MKRVTDFRAELLGDLADPEEAARYLNAAREDEGMTNVAAQGRTAGQVAYERYFQVCHGRSLETGLDLPEWEKLTRSVQALWQATYFAPAKRRACLPDTFIYNGVPEAQ